MVERTACNAPESSHLGCKKHLNLDLDELDF
jgi:hypothetical protein